LVKAQDISARFLETLVTRLQQVPSWQTDDATDATVQCTACHSIMTHCLLVLHCHHTCARQSDTDAAATAAAASFGVQAYAADDGLACHNLIMLLAYCYSAGIVAADCMYR
jgi:hypothetical protein